MISLGWGNADDTILVWRVENHWNYDAFVQALDTTHQLMVSRGYPIDVLIDLQASVHAPNNILDVILAGLRNIPYNTRRVAIIGASQTCVKLYNTAIQNYNLPDVEIYFTTDANEAYDLIYAPDKVANF